MLYINRRDAGNVKRPDGSRFLFSKYDQSSYLFKTNLYPTEDQKITFSYMDSKHKGWEPYAAKRDEMHQPDPGDIQELGWDEAWKKILVYRNQKDQSTSLGYEYSPDDNPLINLHAKLSYSKTSQNDVRGKDDDYKYGESNMGSESWVNYKNTLLDIYNISSVQTGAIEQDVKVGFQWQKMVQNALIHNETKSDDPAYNWGYHGPNYLASGEQKMLSLYLQDDIKLGKLTISPSIRYDKITNQGYGNLAPRYSRPEPIYGHDYSKKSYTGWSPRLGFFYEMSPNVAWFANISHTWRAPRIDEQYETQATSTGTSRILKKEKMHALRIGNILSFKEVLAADDSLQIRTTLFQNKGKDEIFKRR